MTTPADIYDTMVAGGGTTGGYYGPPGGGVLMPHRRNQHHHHHHNNHTLPYQQQPGSGVQHIPSLLSLRPSFTGSAPGPSGDFAFDGGSPRRCMPPPGALSSRYGVPSRHQYPPPQAPGGSSVYYPPPSTAGTGSNYSCQCCVPTGCGHFSDDPVDPNNPCDAAVRVFCSNPDCAIGRWMHGDCYEYWETRVTNYLRSVNIGISTGAKP